MSKEKSRQKTESAYTSNSNLKSGRSASESDYSQRLNRQPVAIFKEVPAMPPKVESERRKSHDLPEKEIAH